MSGTTFGPIFAMSTFQMMVHCIYIIPASDAVGACSDVDNFSFPAGIEGPLAPEASLLTTALLYSSFFDVLVAF